MKKQKTKNYIWNMIGTTLYSFLSLFYLIIITRVNGINDAGIFSFCYSFSLVMYVISNYGGRNYQVSDKGEFNDNNYFSLKVVTSLLSFVITLFFCLFTNYAITKIFVLLLLQMVRVIESFSDVIYGVFQKNDQLDLVGKSNFLKCLSSLIIFTIIDLLTHNLLLSVLAVVLVTFLVYLFYDKKLVKKYGDLRLEINRNSILFLLDKTKYFCLFNLLVSFLGNVPRIVVDFLFTDAEQGYFGIIIMIPSVLSLFGQLIIQPELVNITDSYHLNDTKNLKKKVFQIFLYTTIISAICCFCAYFLGPEVLGFLYGINFSDYRFFLAIIVIAGMFNVYTTFISTILTIMRVTKEQFILFLILVIVEFILLYLGATIYGFNGIFIFYFLIMVISFIIFFIFFKMKWKGVKNENRCSVSNI